MNMVILGAKITMPTHKPKVYWKLRSSAHQKDTPGCETTKAPHQPASKKCVSYFAQQKLRISFCDVDVTFLHSKITTSCKILILHFLHCKTSLVFGDVGLMSHFCVTFVVQNLWGYLEYGHSRSHDTTSTPPNPNNRARTYISITSLADAFSKYV
jgi:hypothetical protein